LEVDNFAERKVCCTLATCSYETENCRPLDKREGAAEEDEVTAQRFGVEIVMIYFSTSSPRPLRLRHQNASTLQILDDQGDQGDQMFQIQKTDANGHRRKRIPMSINR
jgi:hypothetical protein